MNIFSPFNHAWFFSFSVLILMYFKIEKQLHHIVIDSCWCVL